MSLISAERWNQEMQPERQVVSIRVLVIAKDDFFLKAFKKEMENEPVEIVVATSEEEAREIFASDSVFNVIAVGDFAKEERPTTVGLVGELKQKFQGRMIAYTSNWNWGNVLIKAGCDCQIHLSGLAKKVRESIQ